MSQGEQPGFYGVIIPQRGRPPPEGFAIASHGVITWVFLEQADALRFAAALHELDPSARAETREDFPDFAWLMALPVEVDGKAADDLALDTISQGAYERREPMQPIPADAR